MKEERYQCDVSCAVAMIPILSFSLSLVLISIVTGTEVTTEALDTWMTNMTKRKACYDDLGCFDLSNPWFGWSRPVPALPQPPDVIETKFYLVTRENLEMPQLMRTRPVIDIVTSQFKKSKPVYFIVHGYIGHYNDEWSLSLAYQLLNRFDSNVILVDWSNGANTLNYIQAVANARLVGAEMARLTSALTQQQLSHPTKIHALGYSLGAQVISYMANNITGLHRITALDPAQPGFESTAAEVHLEHSDAQFVDVLHTNGVPFLPALGLGMRESIGHVDFFLNGGETQPGCRQYAWKGHTQFEKKDVYQSVQHYLENHHVLNVPVNSIDELQEILINFEIEELESKPSMASTTSFNLLEVLTGTLANLIEYVICSHEKAPKYFIESLQNLNCSFWGVPWEPFQYPAPPENCTYDICTEMGIHSILYPARGNFYVGTNVKAPFCKSTPETDVVIRNSLSDEFLKFQNKCG